VRDINPDESYTFDLESSIRANTSSTTMDALLMSSPPSRVSASEFCNNGPHSDSDGTFQLGVTLRG
jgi:hypothetical protein